jgi:hypothetical protein
MLMLRLHGRLLARIGLLVPKGERYREDRHVLLVADVLVLDGEGAADGLRRVFPVLLQVGRVALHLDREFVATRRLDALPGTGVLACLGDALEDRVASELATTLGDAYHLELRVHELLDLLKLVAALVDVLPLDLPDHQALIAFRQEVIEACHHLVFAVDLGGLHQPQRVEAEKIGDGDGKIPLDPTATEDLQEIVESGSLIDVGGLVIHVVLNVLVAGLGAGIADEGGEILEALTVLVIVQLAVEDHVLETRPPSQPLEILDDVGKPGDRLPGPRPEGCLDTIRLAGVFLDDADAPMAIQLGLNEGREGDLVAVLIVAMGEHGRDATFHQLIDPPGLSISDALGVALVLELLLPLGLRLQVGLLEGAGLVALADVLADLDHVLGRLDLAIDLTMLGRDDTPGLLPIGAQPTIGFDVPLLDGSGGGLLVQRLEGDHGVLL